MGVVRAARPAKLVMSLIASEVKLLEEVLSLLERRYGEVDFKSPLLPFDWTDYYEREMGKGLLRYFVSFLPLIERESLVRIKLETNEIEGEYAKEDGRRRINIDPGYLTAEHLILATTKSYAHRPYLGEGIYADLTLLYRGGEFRPLEWTYPDYASEGVRQIFKGIRERYLAQLRGEKG